MWKKVLLGTIPTFVAGIALMTLATPQKSGVSLNQVKMTAAKSPSHVANHSNHHNPNTAVRANSGSRQPASTSSDHEFRYGYSWYRGYRGYYGYRSYRGYGYRGYHSYRGYGYGYYSYEGNDDEPEEE
ncbi:MAG TPA: hypothetical protein VGH32_10110 [Pirellulales bacterium]